MTRLEKAVAEIVTVATGQLSERAATLLDDTSRRLEAEIRLRRVSDDVEEVERRQERHDQRRRYRHRLVDRAERVNPRSGRLYRDPDNAKIAGVCAGLARYLGFEPWTVRLAALTGLIFIPGVVFPAYWIAYFIMEKPDKTLAAAASDRDRRRRGRGDDTSAGAAAADHDPRYKFDAGRSLRYAGADLTQAELRLRRLESFITSDQYELHRELTKIEREDVPQNGARGAVDSDNSGGEARRGF
jgi:phage shock protein C